MLWILKHTTLYLYLISPFVYDLKACMARDPGTLSRHARPHVYLTLHALFIDLSFHFGSLAFAFNRYVAWHG